LKKNNKIRKNIILVLELIFIAMLIYSLIEIVIWYINNMQNKEINKQIENSIIIETNKENEIEERYDIDFSTLKQTNTDIVGFLKVNGTNIETIIVKGNDNEYYLNHNLDKKYNKAGWVFADYKNKLDGADKNIIIYGHNMKDGSMFGTLENILKEEWYNNEQNRILTFITENEQVTYEVFSVYKIENEDYYITTEFTNEEFEKYLKTVKGRSIKDFNVELKSEDNILTLSTCADNNKYRVVLHAKKIGG